MHRWFLCGCLFVVACGETRENTKRALEAYQPTKKQLAAVFAALPEAPEAKDCDPKLDGKSPTMVDERFLAAVVDQADEPGDDLKKELNNWNTAQNGSLPTAAKIERMMDDPDVSHAFNIERATGMLKNEGYVVVARTDTYHLGKIDGDRIIEKGLWEGWLFIGELESGTIVGAIPASITNDDRAWSFDKAGEDSSLYDNLWLNLRGRLPQLTQEHCGFALSI